MSIGCSKCVCIAIESHQPELLRALLARPNVEHRDIYWEMRPIQLPINSRIDHSDTICVHHAIREDTDLSIVGRPDCGHMQIDVELQCVPAKTELIGQAYALIWLPKLAELHSTKQFPAVKILRDSCKFDFFHHAWL